MRAAARRASTYVSTVSQTWGSRCGGETGCSSAEAGRARNSTAVRQTYVPVAGCISPAILTEAGDAIPVPGTWRCKACAVVAEFVRIRRAPSGSPEVLRLQLRSLTTSATCMHMLAAGLPANLAAGLHRSKHACSFLDQEGGAAPRGSRYAPAAQRHARFFFAESVRARTGPGCCECARPR